MRTADMAQTIFDRITSGAGSAVGRPAVIDKSNSTKKGVFYAAH